MFKVSCNISTKIIQPLKSQLYFEINEALNTPASILFFLEKKIQERILYKRLNLNTYQDFTILTDTKPGYKGLKPFSLTDSLPKYFSFLTKVEKSEKIKIKIKIKIK